MYLGGVKRSIIILPNDLTIVANLHKQHIIVINKSVIADAERRCSCQEKFVVMRQ